MQTACTTAAPTMPAGGRILVDMWPTHGHTRPHAATRGHMVTWPHMAAYGHKRPQTAEPQMPSEKPARPGQTPHDAYEPQVNGSSLGSDPHASKGGGGGLEAMKRK